VLSFADDYALRMDEQQQQLAERVMMDLIQAHQQSNCHEAAFQILHTKTRKEGFQYCEWNANW